MKPTKPKTYIVGLLGYNNQNQRYGMVSYDEWLNNGFQRGDVLDVFLHGHWVRTSMETDGKDWYLFGTDLSGKQMEWRAVRVAV